VSCVTVAEGTQLLGKEIFHHLLLHLRWHRHANLRAHGTYLTTQCVRGVLDPPVSTFSLSLYRHPFLYTLFSYRFTLIINNNKVLTQCERRVNLLVYLLTN
jgi:hypothetical protein